MLQRIGRIVGGADDGNPELPEEPPGRVAGFREQLVAAVEDAPRAARLEQLRDAERALELHVRPVVERVAERVRHRPGPRLELLPVRSIPGAEALRDPVGAHRPPLVVIALQPDLGDRREAVILGDLRHREVAVVVDDRQVFRVAVVELRGHLGLEQEVVVDEGPHETLLPTVRVDRPPAS